MRWWRSFLSALAFLLIGCGCQSNRALEQIIEQTYQIEPTSSIAIDNVDGSIRIYGAEGDELRVRAVKRAYSQERLDKIAVKIAVQPGTVSIETSFPLKQTWGFADRSGTVDYVIVVPDTVKIARLELANGEALVEGIEGGPVHARLDHGWFYAHNCFCDLDLAVGTGALSLNYDWWDEEARFSVDAKIDSGKVLAWLPSDASFHLLAEARTGIIANDFAAQAERSSGRVNKIDKIIGTAAGANIKIYAADGNIKIVKTYP